jgi:hypothetical protein
MIPVMDKLKNDTQIVESLKRCNNMTMKSQYLVELMKKIVDQALMDFNVGDKCQGLINNLYSCILTILNL